MTFFPPKADGIVSAANSTTAPLTGGATYTGAWERNEYSHVLANVVADQTGTLYLDFGIDDGAGGVTATFSQSTPVYASQADFIAAVKGPRWFRARFVNGATAQSSFKLTTAFGSDYLPVSASNDNETLTTVTERERDTFAAYQETGITSTRYACLIDLSDTTNFPHDRTGRIDLTNTFFSADRDSTATGSVRIGVITRIDGTNADIEYVAGVSFEKTDVRSIIRDRKYSPSQLKCGVSGGSLTRIISTFSETTASVNTGVTLNSPRGASTVTPAVGDLVIKMTRTAGTYDAVVSVMYHGEFEA